MGAPPELLQELETVAKTDDVDQFFHIVDADRSGSVNIDEFLQTILIASSCDFGKLQTSRLVKQCDRMQAMLDELLVAVNRDGSSPISCRSRKSPQVSSKFLTSVGNG